MDEIIAYPAVCAGLLSAPAAFGAGLYLIERRLRAAAARPVERWLAALLYSAAVVALWWIAYRFGDGQPFGRPDNTRASLSQMFGFSAYLLLPAAAATGLVSLAGALVSALRADARH